MHIRKLFKIGGSWTCVIPQKYWEYLGLTLGDYVVITLKESSIVLKKLRPVHIVRTKKGGEGNV